MAGIAVIAYGLGGVGVGFLAGSLVHAASISPVNYLSVELGWGSWGGPLMLLSGAALAVAVMIKCMPDNVNAGSPIDKVMKFMYLVAGCGFVGGWTFGALLADWVGWAPVCVFGGVILLCSMPSCLGGMYGVLKGTAPADANGNPKEYSTLS